MERALDDCLARVERLTTERLEAGRQIKSFEHPREPGWIYLQLPSGQVERQRALPDPRQSDLLSLGALVQLVNEKDADEVWIGETQITVEFESTYRLDRAHLELHPTVLQEKLEEMACEEGLVLTLAELRRLLKIDLAPQLRDGKFLSWLQRVQFDGRTTDGRTASGSSLGRDVELKSLSSEGEMPDCFILEKSLRAFSNALPTKAPDWRLTVWVELDFDQKRFTLLVRKEDYESWLQSERQAVADTIREGLLVQQRTEQGGYIVPIYFGTP